MEHQHHQQLQRDSGEIHRVPTEDLPPPRTPPPAYFGIGEYNKESQYVTPIVDVENQWQRDSSFLERFRTSQRIRMICILVLSFLIIVGIAAGVIALLALR
ncbi:hypothetical protein ABW19_dt0201108 [Dactylella cylindrospora]|nr:hypothetical protein ABW19_dt0201108 [Dactylella cylindrospora]